ncbi:Peroxin 13, N-terminal region-domain-containing protein [Phascolomyces articulosus]|uniref:Peroxisomal membrane protein PEX13 n=1 Tax=Phascolomyces articulosus TaxID=60185 RepID=A0AAD5P739_9FUNG|nr:Peroxin 13, N-terminal region-domain-containing protein [Phascolomyces articulosus]
MPESPPKPWEQAQGTSSATSTLSNSNAITSPSSATDAISSGVGDSPAVPGRPSTMGSAGYGGMGSLGSSYGTGYGSSFGGLGSSYGGYGSSYGGLGSSMYGGYGGMSRFGSSYGGYGGYGSSMYGGYGSSMYGGYGGMNRFGGGMYGGDEFSMQQRMESSTRATFDIIQQIVGAFGGFAQMLDSTFMATYSSFMAMVGVAEQFGYLQNYLGNLFSIYAWIRWFKRLFYRLRGKEIPPELLEPTPEQQQQQGQDQQEGQQLQLEGPEGQEQQSHQQKPKRRSLLYILAVFVGLPYAIYKLIMAARQYHERRMLLNGREEIATAMYDFVAEGPMELNLRQGDTVIITSKVDPATGQPSDWWQGHLQNGARGIFPANYVTLQPPTNDFSKKIR